MLKKISYLMILWLFAVPVRGQIWDPVSWDFSYEKTGNRQYELIFTATIEEGSHIYSMDIPAGGPIPTSIRIDTLKDYTPEGPAYEVTRPEEVFDEAFGFKIKSFSKKAEFRQKVTLTASSATVTGVVNFMACNNVTCSPPKDVEFEIRISESGTTQVTAEKGKPAAESNLSQSRRGLFGFFLLSMLGGFAGILTPCVFPMIPLTVAFFSRQSENRKKSVFNASVFGLSIILIYGFLGIIVSLTSAGAGFANTISAHWIPNTIFFLLFVIFAVSFFGAFEIVLPNKWVSGADAKVDKGGIFSSFFMGLTTVIVSFSCTGPIVGALLVEAASGDVLRPTIGMFGFGLAFALPFTLFALFPSVLNKLPKSGSWLNSIKVVLGFIMLAFSMKFLETIDSVYSFDLISRDLYLAVWIVLAFLLGLYLMGKIKFRHDSDLKHIGTFRLFLIVAVFVFGVYLITGLFGAPLKGLSALLPSQETSWYTRRQSISEKTPVFSPSVQPFGTSALCSEPKFGDLFKMPLGLTGYFDYRQGIACAKEMGKPALIDFKGHACANCKVMEAKVWSDPEVFKRLSENFVIIALYADDRTQLPENEWYVSEIDGKQKKTIGKQNEDLEISRYKTNTLPLYVITDFNGIPLVEPMPTNYNVEAYKEWLDEGVEAFKSRYSK
ncbi:MAG: sulfite exporter TauE/SafE family protein [Bacteroidales bacterium]|nr:sulfite exporter TauE/SafE family protein [Bacteroidales bacterium]